MNSLEIREFSQSIINFANKSTLPVEVKRLVFSDILKQLEDAAHVAIQSELQERNKEEQDVNIEQTVQQD